MFDINRFKNGEIAVLCITQEQAEKFFRVAGDAGIRWRGGDDPRRVPEYDHDYTKYRGGNVYIYRYRGKNDQMSRGSLKWFEADARCRKYELVNFTTIEVETDEFISLLMGDTRME